MAFELFTDSSANLTPDLAAAWGAKIVPLHYCLNDAAEQPCYDEKAFDGHAFYEKLRNGAKARTSMINVAEFFDAFEPCVRAGKDILYVGMSSGISGTVRAAQTAAAELQGKYRNCRIIVKDSLAASLGEGMFLHHISKMRETGKTVEMCAEWFDKNVQRLNQFLAVGDLGFLRAGGRISGISALVGTLARIKPVLWGNREGKFSMADRSIGRKKSLRFMANQVFERMKGDDNKLIAIAHADCEEDANYLVGLIREKRKDAEFLIRCYEPGTGAHAGPDALAVFFFGDER